MLHSILITGAASGIGLALTRHFAAQGHRVIACDLQHPDIDGTIRKLAFDVADAAQIEQALTQVADDPPDVLINNAGLQYVAPLEEYPPERWQQLIAVMLTGAAMLTRATLPVMRRKGFGRIVNIGSIAGTRAIASPVHYAASKGALEGMTHSLAHELGRYGILTNCISAGIFDGGLRSTIPEHHQKRYIDACALGRIGQPGECGELAAWLASPRNTYLNGAVIVLDGGTLA